MRVSSFSSVIGFDRNKFTGESTCPLNMPSSLSVDAVCIAITQSFAPCIVRNARATSSPGMSGSLKSHSTISGCNAAAASSASRPVETIRTSSPLLRMNSAVASARSAWSSMSKTRRCDRDFLGLSGFAFGKGEDWHIRSEKTRTTLLAIAYIGKS
jgi:hypothetical protein